MSKYKMEDGSVVNTDKAKNFWKEATNWDGRNHISVPTGSQWQHERLYQSTKDRFYINSWSNWQGSEDTYRYVSEAEAVTWLLQNGHDESIPESLKALVADVEE